MYSKGMLLIKYIFFWLKASNGKGHGIHSPFVFDFIQQILMKKCKESSTVDFPIPSFGHGSEEKYRKLVQRMVNYYKHHQIYLHLFDNNQTFSNYGKNEEQTGLMDIHVFSGIRISSASEKRWVEIKKSEKVTCSIDLFFVGILFFKKDFKEKLDFMIRF
jgi:hypothetical protein